MVISKLEAYQFDSVNQAIRWYQTHNPARQKFLNILEPERGNKPQADDFCTENPVFLWINVVGAIEAILCELDRDRRQAFLLCEIGQNGERVHPVEAAKLFRVHPRTVYRWLQEIREKLEREMQQREILEPTA